MLNRLMFNNWFSKLHTLMGMLKGIPKNFSHDPRLRAASPARPFARIFNALMYP